MKSIKQSELSEIIEHAAKQIAKKSKIQLTERQLENNCIRLWDIATDLVSAVAITSGNEIEIYLQV